MKKTIWILLDNRVGSRHQAEGIANYLNKEEFNIVNKELSYNIFAGLPNFIRSNTLLGLTSLSKEGLKAPFPDIVLSSSRRTAPVARWIKKKSPRTKIFQLMHIGRFGIKDFTTIYAPEHDNYKFTAPNIKYTLGSPHFITKEKLNEAKSLWQNKFNNLPKPITALIIGGAIKKHPFSMENAKELTQKVRLLKEKEGGSLLITTSRRTGLEAQNLIMSELKKFPHFAYLWGDTSPNPYLGFLACADDLIVTGDSVSMCCEATATGKPLRIFTGQNWLTKKHLRFVQTLFEKKYAFDFAENTIQATSNPLNIAKDIAESISSACKDD